MPHQRMPEGQVPPASSRISARNASLTSASKASTGRHSTAATSSASNESPNSAATSSVVAQQLVEQVHEPQRDAAGLSHQPASQPAPAPAGGERGESPSPPTAGHPASSVAALTRPVVGGALQSLNQPEPLLGRRQVVQRVGAEHRRVAAAPSTTTTDPRPATSELMAHAITPSSSGRQRWRQGARRPKAQSVGNEVAHLGIEKDLDVRVPLDPVGQVARQPLTYARREMESDAGWGTPAVRPPARSCSATESGRQAALAVPTKAVDADPARPARLPAPEPTRS